MGSKNKIAQKIVDFLPKAEHFYDLFGGGGAISHCAYLSNKYKSVHYNEYEPLVYKGFQMAINGEFKDEKRWISREDFFKLKDTDPYVAICFSFGTNLQAYAYGKDIEPIKKAFHYAICFDDYSMLDEYLGEYKVRLTEKTIFNRRIELQRYLTKLYRRGFKDIEQNLILHVKDGNVSDIGTNLERLDRIQQMFDGTDSEGGQIRGISSNLQSLERLNSINDHEIIHTRCQNLEHLDHLNDIKVNKNEILISNLSYDQVQIDPNSTIYCDPPYKDTASYKSEFDHDKFYEWCLQQKNVYISEYQMPEEDFKCIWCITKSCSFSSVGCSETVEKIYTPRSNKLFREFVTFEYDEW